MIKTTDKSLSLKNIENIHDITPINSQTNYSRYANMTSKIFSGNSNFLQLNHKKIA
jgi:hypothetical protein